MKFIALVLLQLTGLQSELLRELSGFQNNTDIQHGTVAAHIQRISDGQEVLNFNAKKAVNSASTLKLITTATVLSQLSADFKFKTELGYSGKISGKQLLGDLIIIPDGDPSLGSERSPLQFNEVLEDCIAPLKALGVEKISGNVIIRDLSTFSYDVPDSWIWGDLGNYYGAIPHHFNINENKYTVYFNPGHSVDEPTEIYGIQPMNPNWRIINNVKTGKAGSGDQVYIYASPSSETILMKGTVPLGENHFAVKGSIPNPAGLFRYELLRRLSENGIEVEQSSIEPGPAELMQITDFHLLHRFLSEPLSKLARDCNYNSINLYADAFLHHLAGNQFSNFEKGLENLKDFWLQKGLSLSGFHPRDGSGLSPSGTITAQNMTDILVKASKEPSFPAFFESIPVYGETGSVRFKDRGHITRGRVRAKSGYIDGTRAYAGYVEDKTGELYAFMICVNRYEPEAGNKVRLFLDNFVVKMGSR
jgi:D-alanyl-D-alanine carboxypeptidase/D-alanyl-D-alanine-endopeptidase (penicillin-binding protein 4)